MDPCRQARGSPPVPSGPGTHLRARGGDAAEGGWYPQAIMTLDGLAVLYNGTDVALQVDEAHAYRFRAWNTQQDGPLPAVDPRPTLWNATASNYKYREVLDGSAVFLGADDDGELQGAIREWMDKFFGTAAKKKEPITLVACKEWLADKKA